MAIAVVQSAKGVASSGSTIAAAFTSNTTTGNTIVVVAQPFIGGAPGTTLAVSSIAISAGAATFSKIIAQAGVADQFGDNEAWAAAAITGGTTPTVTATLNGTLSAADIYIYEVSGLAATLTQDGTAASNTPAASTACTSAAITTTNASDIIFSAFSVGSNVTAAGSGWTGLLGAGTGGVAEYQIVTSTQTNLSATATQSSSATYSGIIFALKSPATGPQTVSPSGIASSVVFGTATLAGGISVPQPPPQAVAAGYTQLSFHDEFDGPLDIGLGVGGHKWNGGLWYETVPPGTDFTISNSVLTITATATTNTNLCTQYWDGSAAHGTSFQGGYFEARMYCTDWSAFWLYRWTQPYGAPIVANNPLSWINEIDIIETDPGASYSNLAFCTLHKNTGGTSVADEGNHGGTDQFLMPGGGLTQSQWHIYGVLWTQTAIIFYVDNIQVVTMAPYPSTWQPTQLILSAQPGGVTGQSSSTVLPPITEVDWVRVWQPSPGSGGSGSSGSGSGTITPILSAAGY